MCIYIYVNQYRTKSGQFEAGDQQTAQRTRLKVAEEKQRQEKEVTGRDDGFFRVGFFMPWGTFSTTPEIIC